MMTALLLIKDRNKYMKLYFYASITLLPFILTLLMIDRDIIMDLPLINACLNMLSSVFLILGWITVKKNKVEAHKKLMITAFATSALFLACYLSIIILLQVILSSQVRGQFVLFISSYWYHIFY